MVDTAIKDGVSIAPLDGTEKVPMSRTSGKDIGTTDNIATYTLLQQLAQHGLSTGWLSGGLITQNANPAKVDISAGSGIIVDATDAAAVTSQFVTWTEKLAVDPQFLATDAAGFMAINAAGALVQENVFPDNGDLRTKIQLGGVAHGDNTTITGISNFTSAPPFQIAATVTDFMTAIGVINLFGNVFAGSGNANLKFSKTVGKIFYAGIATKEQPDNENHINTPAHSEENIIFSWRDGAGGHTTRVADAIVAGVYDNNSGGDANGPDGTVVTNNWVNCRIKYSPDVDLAVIEYGDATHNLLATAINALKTDSYGDNPAAAGFPVKAYVTLRGAAVNTDIAADAVFTDTDKFGGI